MTDTIPAGSYLIRHVGTGQALSYAGQDKLTTEIRDEGNPQYREAQTWWIEPIPEQHEFGKKIPTLYTITRLVEGKSLDAPERKNGGILCTYRSHGAPWQLWRFVRLPNCDRCVCYSIISEYSGLAIDKGHESKGQRAQMWEYNIKFRRQHWELMIPVSPMTNTIPAGSYLIRHVGTGQALSYAGQDKLTTEIRDEGNPQYREAQTWWIEPIPEQHEFRKEIPTLYTITRLVEGKSLDAPERRNGGILCTYRSHGAPWQLWRFVQLLDRDGCVCYSIISEHSGLAIDKGHENEGHPAQMWEYNTNFRRQHWELVIPVSPVPVGWHHLKNVSTGHILSQSYPSSLPILISPIELKHTSNYRETWGTQWAIIHNRVFTTGAAVASFQIKNRLTSGFLRARGNGGPEVSKVEEDTVRAWQTDSPGGEKHWALETDARKNWKIVEEATRDLLGEALGTSFGGGNTLECCSKQADPRRSWRLIPMEEVDADVKNVRFPWPYA